MNVLHFDDNQEETEGNQETESVISPRGWQTGETLRVWRLFAVIAGFSPLLVLLAIRGMSAIPDIWLWVVCGAVVVFSNAALFLRVFLVRRHYNPRVLKVGRIKDSRHHILIYLFATLLPFYRQDIGDPRAVVALMLALTFMIFLFWHLHLHYVNTLLAIFKYRMYVLYPEEGPHSRRSSVVLVTKERDLRQGDTVRYYRLDSTFYWGLRR